MPRYSQELLAQARMLADLDPNRPKQANLRRSVSASYYALFHFLIEEATRLAFGTQHAQAPMRNFAGRAFVHNKMKPVCEDFQKQIPSSKILGPWWGRLPIAGNADLILIAGTFVDLQQQRHTADYDLDAMLLRADARNAATSAQQAIAAWARLQAATPKIANLFATSLMLWPGLSGR
jgi:hypothetical protein